MVRFYCDRCDELIPFALARKRIIQISDERGDFKTYELCLDCANKLEKFMGGNIEYDSDDSVEIRDSELSRKTRNALMREGVKTVGDLRHKSKRQIQNIRGIGKTAMREIGQFLKWEEQ